jgi:hypothetical protein
MSRSGSVVAIYDTHAHAEEALKELQRARFDMKTVSVLVKDYQTDEHLVGYYSTGDRMMYWGKFRDFWSGVWGLLAGGAFFAIPGIGPVLIAGPLVGWIVRALEGAAVVSGISALGVGLSSIGIPQAGVQKYEAALREDNCVLIVHGDEALVVPARRILTTTAAAEVALHTAERPDPAVVLVPITA